MMPTSSNGLDMHGCGIFIPGSGIGFKLPHIRLALPTIHLEKGILAIVCQLDL